jgi:5-methylcytosine-specific restriction endonuclease McrA
MKNKWWIKNRIGDEEFIAICRTSKTMAQAASSLKLHFNSFKKRAIELGCYCPNKPGKGIRKNSPAIPLFDIIHHNLHPQYQSFKLKRRLIQEGIKNCKCEHCGIEVWNGKPLVMELHHVDGNSKNHYIDNLRLLCPNCHSQTDTFRAKNKKN